VDAAVQAHEDDMTHQVDMKELSFRTMAISMKKTCQELDTDCDGFLSYLRSKGAWLGDVERHPVCLGVPLGVTGSSGRTVAVDLGLKSPAAMPLRELAACSPYVERALIKHALAPGPAELPDFDALLRESPPVPVAVVCKEDMQSLPIASPVHPSALGRRISKEQLDAMLDPFFQAQRGDGAHNRSYRDSDEFAALVVDAVPDADTKLTAMREWRKEQRKQFQVSLGTASLDSDLRPELSSRAMADLARKQAAHAAKLARDAPPPPPPPASASAAEGDAEGDAAAGRGASRTPDVAAAKYCAPSCSASLMSR